MATRKIVPRADNEGGIGTALKQWASGWIKALTVTTINALTLAAATVGFTIAGGTTPKTLTVDETVAMSNKAPKASPVFTGDIKGSTAGGQMAVVNPTNTGVHHVGNSDPIAILDNQTITFTIPSGAILVVGNGSAGQAALFFATYASSTITKLSDLSSAFEITNTDTGKICVFKNAVTTTVSIKNYTNGTILLYVDSFGVIGQATAPA